MKIFISDLHLGDGSRTDDFHRDEQFLEFLEFVESQAQELVILGDLFELWQADLNRISFKHSKVLTKLLSLKNSVKVTYVVGNHDFIPFIKFVNSNVGISLEYRDTEYGIVAEHGHRYDVFNSYKNPLKSIKWPFGKYFSLLTAGLERLIHPNVDGWAQSSLENLDDFLNEAASLKNKVTPATKEYIRRGGHFGEFEQAVKDHMHKGAKVVIFGHIHKWQLQPIGEGVYANCGAWVDNVEPTYIACHRDKIEVKEALSHKIIKQCNLTF